MKPSELGSDSAPSAFIEEIDPGYSVFTTVFPPADMVPILDSLAEAEIDRTRAGARHVLRVPPIQELAHDRRLVTIASQFVGHAAVPFRATLFDKSPGSNWLVTWHQDTALPLCGRVDSPEWGPWSTKAGVLYAHAPDWALETIVALRVSLDDSTPSNGPLRVLPGSHRGGVLSIEQIERLAQCTTAIDCPASAGGVVAMRPLTVHASWKSADHRPRRVLHIEYAASVYLGSGVELAVG
jgi:ectoine hydroxylase-related dioxygenase (phytanoyl-CoA dioxygenase family)